LHRVRYQAGRWKKDVIKLSVMFTLSIKIWWITQGEHKEEDIEKSKCQTQKLFRSVLWQVEANNLIFYKWSSFFASSLQKCLPREKKFVGRKQTLFVVTNFLKYHHYVCHKKINVDGR
jgi:hypothetical protein